MFKLSLCFLCFYLCRLRYCFVGRVGLRAGVQVCSLTRLPRRRSQLVRTTVGTAKRSCTPCSGFRIKTTTLLRSNAVVANDGRRGTTCPSNLYTRQITLFRTNRRCPSVPIITLTVTTTAGNQRIRDVSPYNTYHRILLRTRRHCNGPVGILLYNAGRIIITRDTRSLLPLYFKTGSLGWGEETLSWAANTLPFLCLIVIYPESSSWQDLCHFSLFYSYFFNDQRFIRTLCFKVSFTVRLSLQLHTKEASECFHSIFDRVLRGIKNYQRVRYRYFIFGVIFAFRKDMIMRWHGFKANSFLRQIFARIFRRHFGLFDTTLTFLCGKSSFFFERAVLGMSILWWLMRHSALIFHPNYSFDRGNADEGNVFITGRVFT